MFIPLYIQDENRLHKIPIRISENRFVKNHYVTGKSSQYKKVKYMNKILVKISTLSIICQRQHTPFYDIFSFLVSFFLLYEDQYSYFHLFPHAMPHTSNFNTARSRLVIFTVHIVFVLVLDVLPKN